MAHPGGRPTDYSPRILEQFEEYMKEAIPENMDLPTVEGLALKLDITKDTLYRWGKKYSEFSDALRKLKITQKQILTKIGIYGGKEINSNIVSLLLKVNHKMIETERKEITGKGGTPIFMPSEIIDKNGISSNSKPGSEG